MPNNQKKEHPIIFWRKGQEKIDVLIPSLPSFFLGGKLIQSVILYK
jgi:hypothetical protein